MSINIKLNETSASINRKLLGALNSELKRIFNKSLSGLTSEIRKIVKQAILSTPEVDSLKYGKLKADFGLTNDYTDLIAENIALSTEVQLKTFKLSLSGFSNVLTIYINSDRMNVLLSSFYSQQVTEKGVSLPWLEWLLMSGDSIIIQDYHVDYGLYQQSRSGMALMFPKGFYRVPPEFSGTEQNNFITRALEKYEKQIQDIIVSFNYA